MRVLVDGLSLGVSSVTIVIEQMLRAWAREHPEDHLHLLTGADAVLSLPDIVVVHRARGNVRNYAVRVAVQTVVLPRLCRRLGVDVLLAAIPTTSAAPLPCPRVIMVHDLRHELRPQQFSRRSRLLRGLSYGLSYRQADGIVCVSERTRADLMRSRPWLSARNIRVATHGSDHVASWRASTDTGGYAVTFGQHSNKNVCMAIDAWQILSSRGSPMPLMVFGVGTAQRNELERRVTASGLVERVILRDWTPDQEFRAIFAAASLVVFPSDFEGFGLPAVEAMALGIPLVISPDAALLEVCDGHATVMRGWHAAALADAVAIASARTPTQLEAARRHAAAFTWGCSVKRVRETLLTAIDRHAPTG